MCMCRSVSGRDRFACGIPGQHFTVVWLTLESPETRGSKLPPPHETNCMMTSTSLLSDTCGSLMHNDLILVALNETAKQLRLLRHRIFEFAILIIAKYRSRAFQ